MITTENGMFEIGIVNSTMTNLIQQASPEEEKDKEFDKQNHKLYNALILSNERMKPKQYICVEKNEAFQIKMEQKQVEDKRVTFGVVLFLNGQRVHGKKTMRKFGWFQGFKKGNGIFSQFVFTTPDMMSMEQNPEDSESNRAEYEKQNVDQDPNQNSKSGGQMIDDKHKGKKGTIIVEFYKTKEFQRPMRSYRSIHQKTYETHFVSDQSKKSFNETLTIKEGQTFQIPQKAGNGGNGGGNGNNNFNRQNNQDSGQNNYSSPGGDNYRNNRNDRNTSKYNGNQGNNGYNNKRDSKYNDKNNNNQYGPGRTQNNYNSGGGRGNGGSDNRGRGGGGNFSDRNNNDRGGYSDRGGGNRNNDRGYDRNRGGGGGGDYNSNNYNRGNDNRNSDNRNNGNNDNRGYNNNRDGGINNDNRNQGNQEQMSYDHEILWNDGPCDSIEIHYVEWTYLQFHKLVDIQNYYEHIKLVPKMLVESQEFMTKCLKTIVRQHGKMHYSKCDDEFLKATGGNYRISDFFEFQKDQLKDFLLLKKDHFKVDAEGYATVIDKVEMRPIDRNGGQHKQKIKKVVQNKNTCEVIQLD